MTFLHPEMAKLLTTTLLSLTSDFHMGTPKLGSILENKVFQKILTLKVRFRYCKFFNPSYSKSRKGKQRK
jgi:hypothetical protein